MIDRLRLLIKSLTAAQEQLGVDAVPPATANEIIDILGMGGKTAHDLLDQAQREGLVVRRWGGFVAMSHSGREVARGPMAAVDEDSRLELAMAELATSIVFLRRMPLTAQIALDARNLLDEARSAIVTLARSAEEDAAANPHVDRIGKLATRISQSRHADKRLLAATARVSDACSAVNEVRAA